MRDRINDAELQAGHHRRRRLAARARSCRSRRTPTRRSRSARRRDRHRAQAHRPGDRHAGRPRHLVGRVRRRAPRPSARPSRWTPRTCCTSSTPRGSTGKPKGIIHTTGGYLAGIAATHKWVFDLKEDDVYWCTADVGWVTGHSYVVYGPLANGATTVMYEGTPDFPDKDRFWRSIEKHGVTICYTAPTAIRTFMRWGDQYPDRTTSRACGCSAPWASRSIPEAWVWYREGDRRRPLPGRRHVVADRDRQHPDHAAARRHRAQAGLGDAGRSPASTPRSLDEQGKPCRQSGRLPGPRASRGRACCAASGAIPSAS